MLQVRVSFFIILYTKVRKDSKWTSGFHQSTPSIQPHLVENQNVKPPSSLLSFFCNIENLFLCFARKASGEAASLCLLLFLSPQIWWIVAWNRYLIVKRVVLSCFSSVMILCISIRAGSMCRGPCGKKNLIPNYYFSLENLIDICFFSKYQKYFLK